MILNDFTEYVLL